MTEPHHDSVDPQEEPDDELSKREKPMGFMDHLEELRWVLMKSAIAFTICAVGIGLFLKKFNVMLMSPLYKVAEDYPDMPLDLGTVSVMESFTVVIQMCVVGGLILSAPLLVIFAGKFVSPALKETELKLVIPVCLAATLLFLAGVCFSFFLLVPGTIRVSLELNEMFGFIPRWTPGSYYGILIWLSLGVGAAFEFPLLIVLMAYLDMVTSEQLRGWWRHALIVCFVVAAVVTPTPDPINQSILAGSLYVLYGISIIAARRVEKHKREQEVKRQ